MNKRLAILGHQTRGKEVMKILEMLGGHSYSSGLLGKAKFYYYIGNYNSISYISEEKLNDSFITFTLEKFLEQFPYKVGDKVKVPYEDGRITGNELYEYKILKIKWDSLESTIKYGLPTGDEQRIEYYSTDNLNRWNKKETMKETIIDTIKENEDRYRIHVNYQFDIEVDEGEYYLVRRKPQYPKSYEDCCKILNTPIDNFISKGSGYKAELLSTFQKLLICRDAYWKIAGEQMGLGKPWEPDWSNKEQSKYVIYTSGNAICVCRFVLGNNVLAFPTEEMRDAFLENFKELIDFCKELL
jgi:hypothetical protein